MDDVLQQAVVFMETAAASGVVGNSAYAAVARLGDWLRSRRGRHASDLSGAEAHELELLLAAARDELGASSIQVVKVGRDNSGNIINAPNSEVHIKPRG